jgi:hypothetical protein
MARYFEFLSQFYGFYLPHLRTYGDLTLQVGGSLESETVKYGRAGLGAENDCSGEGQQQLFTTYLPSRKRGCYISAMTVRGSVEKKSLIVSFKGLVAKTK